jgi:hypothetical protein
MENHREAESQQTHQQCAICLDDLFHSHSTHATKNSATENNEPKNNIGAVSPCGHCYHVSCYRQWQLAHHRRRISSRSSSGAAAAAALKCPMCNGTAEHFIKLYLNPFSRGGGDKNYDDKNQQDDFCNVDADNLIGEQQYTCLDTSEEMLAQHERIQIKLKRYKRQNKTLRKELRSERHEMEEMLVSTIQNFYKIIEKHEEERKRWSQGTMELRKELDAAKAAHAQEQREWTIQQKRMQQELHRVKQDCARAEHRVQRAADGLEDLKLCNAKRNSKLQALLQDKARLVNENRKLKKVVLTSQGSVRSDRLF